VFFSSMLTTVQTTDLLEGIPKGCNNVLEWSKDNRIAILTKSGVYVLSLTPMAFSSSSSLNTIPEFYANPEDESDQAVQVGWMNKIQDPNQKFMIFLTIKILKMTTLLFWQQMV
jgi:hypothetical protein